MDALTLMHVESFAQAVICPEVHSYLHHLGVPQDVHERLPRLAYRFLDGRNHLLPCLESIQDRSETTAVLSEAELHELAALAVRCLPSHRDGVEEFFWVTQVFTTFPAIIAKHPIPLPYEKVALVEASVATFNSVLDPIDDTFDVLEKQWSERYHIEDRLPFSVLFAMISWRYYRSLWREIRSVLTEEELVNFVEWARSVSTHDRRYGELTPP